MTVQELIDALSAVPDKSVNAATFDWDIDGIEESKDGRGRPTVVIIPASARTK